MSFDQLWADLLPLGRHRGTGGYRRYALTAAERECRDWFVDQATRRGMTVHTDDNRNLWAWRGDPDADGPGVLTGSHLDSVPDGGAYDGPLGIVSAFAALDLLDQQPDRPGIGTPLGIVAFADEEGARFGLPCAGSRLLTGAVDAADVLARTDADGVSYERALHAAGYDPERCGPDPETLGRIGTFVELHIEQGRGLAIFQVPAGSDGEDHAVALGERIWPHGRWRFEFTGRADHAGTTRMADRADPMLSFAMTALAANKRARLTDTRATFGRIRVEPNGTNAIPSAVTGWLDARAPDDEALDELVASLTRQSEDRAGRDQTALTIHRESRTTASIFDSALIERLAAVLARELDPEPTGTPRRPPVLPTAAGHDAGILADAGIPTAMLFVRNPTGVSHSPTEYADPADCRTGVRALAAVLRELARPGTGESDEDGAPGGGGAG